MSRLLSAALLLAFLVPSCLSPEPGVEPSPDAELRASLTRLRDLRGGDFETDGFARGDGPDEGPLVREVRTLAFKHPRHVPTLVANAALCYEQGDSIGAQRYLDQALEVDPDDRQATLLRVRIAAEDGSLHLARRLVEERLRLAPDDAALREAHAGILYLQQEHAAAESELDAAELLADSEEGAWRIAYHRGLLAEASGDMERAREHYARCNELNPDFESAVRRWRWAERARANGGS